MEPVRLKWRRFQSFLRLREEFRGRPCIYLQTDPHEHVLRVGESEDLWNRYRGGTAYTVEAAMHGSGNLFFAAPAPADQPERRRLEATLIYELQPVHNNQHKDFPPIRPVEYIHEGDVPRTLAVSSATLTIEGRSMRGLYAIPTRMRRSEWYLLEGDLRIVFSSTRTSRFPGLTRPGILEFRPPSGSWLRLLPESEEEGISKILRELARSCRGGFDALAGHSREVAGHTRVLLRHIARADEEAYWDIVVSPRDLLSVSITGVIENSSGQAEFERLLNELLPQARPIQWPPWVPNDEALPVEGGDEPSALDQEVWSAIKQAFLEVLPLEEDQIFFALELSRLEKDSLDDLLLWMKLEEWLGISIDDEQAAEFEKARTVGDVYSMVMQLRAQHRKERDQA